jgi:hypothetical protein
MLSLWLPVVPTLVVVGASASAWVPVWNATITTVRQSVTRPELLGRVHATDVTDHQLPRDAARSPAGRGGFLSWATPWARGPELQVVREIPGGTSEAAA